MIYLDRMAGPSAFEEARSARGIDNREEWAVVTQ